MHFCEQFIFNIICICKKLSVLFARSGLKFLRPVNLNNVKITSNNKLKINNYNILLKRD